MVLPLKTTIFLCVPKGALRTTASPTSTKGPRDKGKESRLFLSGLTIWTRRGLSELKSIMYILTILIQKLSLIILSITFNYL